MHKVGRVFCMIVRGIVTVAVMPLIKACETLDRLIEDEYADEYEDADEYDEDDL